MSEKPDISTIPIYPDSYRANFKNIFINCLKTKVDKKFKSKYCLHLILIKDLFILKERGVSQIIATRDNCDLCPERKNRANKKDVGLLFDDTLDKFNRMLDSKEIPTLAIQWIDENSWNLMMNEQIYDQSKHILKKQISRREFFQKLTRSNDE